MMRNILIFIFLYLICTFSQAGEWVPITSNTSAPADISLISGNPAKNVIKYSLTGYERTRISMPHGTAYSISIPGGSYMLEAGSPEVQKITTSLMIPPQDEMDVKVISSKYVDFSNIDVVPSKGNLTRDINPASIAYTYGKPYNKAGFYPGFLASLRDPYILRDVRGQALQVYPFQYDASTKTLRVYYEIIVEVYSTGNTGYNTLPQSASTQVNQEFHHIYNRHFLNYGQVKYTPLADHGKMLIISHANYISAMQPFVEWKNMSGIPTEIVDVATIGVTAAAIKSYVQTYYTTHGLTFLLLVGDAQHVPTIMASSGHSDNSYGYLVGNDSYPEVFVGRFSAESVADVETQVLRTILYERDPSPQAGHFNRSIGIASDEGPGDDNEMDYVHVRNMLTDLLGYTYTYGAELYEGSQGGNDQPGNPTAAMVASELNTGAGIVLYTGHGSTTSWGTTGFSNTNINNLLTNSSMLPFIWSVACVNGNFVNNTCFAETWMRARNGDLPAGAVATLMSTINQSWNPPMEGQDEMVDILVESYAANIKRTFGGLSMNGCMKMNDTYGGAGAEMTDTWNLFGDPSLMVRTDTPQLFTATHLPTLLLGSSQLSVTCPLTEGLATLSLNGQILSSLPVVNGMVNLTFNPLLSLDPVTLVVTSYNKIPYIAQIPVIPATGPYVIYCQHQVDDSQGNQNGMADYGETLQLNVSLQNMGVMQANQVTANIQTSSPYLSITNALNTWGNVAAGDTNLLLGAFEISVSPNAPDQHTVLFNLNVADSSGNNWTSSFTLKLNAPVLALGGIMIDDAQLGNGNGIVDPGETIKITIPSLNLGHSASPAANLLLASSSPFVTIDTALIGFPGLNAGNSQHVVYTIHIDSSIALGSSIDLHAFLNAGNFQDQKVYFIAVGIVGEDFESGDFTKFPWTFGGSSNWVIESANPYAGSFSARSGAIGNNSATELIVTMDVLMNDSISFYRKVSSESGYDFLEFYIDNNKVDQWSGEVTWGRKAYLVTAGVRTFKWRYVKDWYMIGGSDRAWLDDIVFPPVALGAAPLLVSAVATPTTICEGESAQLFALANLTGPNLTYSWSPPAGLDNPATANPLASPTATTTYSVTVNDGSSTASADITIEVRPRPATPSITVFGPDLTSSATSGNQWYDSTGAIQGAIDQVFTPSVSGKYYVIVTDTNGCASLPSNVITFTWTGIPDTEETPAFHFWPNPSKGVVTAAYYLKKPAKVSISLIDVLGNTVRLLYDGNDPSGYYSKEFNLEGVSRGLYFLRYQREGQQGLHKLLLH